MSAEFHKVTDDFWVTGQIDAEDVAAAAKLGIRMILNNRPDEEEPGQPSGADIEAAARAAGLDYATAPVRGRPAPSQVDATGRALAAADGPVLAYCRSGMRSIAAWALSQVSTGARTRADAVALAKDAGYDLSQVL
jgi:uncharacterized protein (TIGR01244 family)